jgi:CYTH domain-containing protein
MGSQLPGQGRYAHVERERRFLLAVLPDGLSEPRSIVDRHVLGTHLRLRKVTTPGGFTYKLAQKVRLVGDDPSAVKITNIYLDAAEYELLAALPADGVTKTRCTLTQAGWTFAVDQFHGLLEGLLLAEVELTSDSAHVEIPPFAVRDVTTDDRYTGGRLAAATAREIAGLISPPGPSERSHDDHRPAG